MSSAMKVYTARWRDKAVANGKCRHCGKDNNSTNNKSLCVECRDKNAARKRQLVHDRRLAKECIRCGAPAIAGQLQCQTHANISSEKAKRYRLADKLIVFSRHAPYHDANGAPVIKCAHPDCGVSDIEMLTLGHIHNDGAKHRSALGVYKAGAGFYKHMIKVGLPDGFQILCWNHNIKKECDRRRTNIVGGFGSGGYSAGVGISK